MAINPLEFNERAEFGADGTTGYNPKNGNPIKGFVASFSRWFGYRTQNLTQQYTFAGSNSTETILIAIRHDDLVVKTLNVKINDTVYSIYNISPDKSFGRDTVDLITLQKVVKNG